MPDWEAKLGNRTAEQSREAVLGSNMGINTGKPMHCLYKLQGHDTPHLSRTMK